jgi:hypothetical protein
MSGRLALAELMELSMARKTDPQPPPTEELPKCDQCGFPTDAARGELTKLWARSLGLLHEACRRVLDDRMEGKL